MKEFEDKEQVLLAYYVQYYRGATTEDIKALDQRLSQEIGKERYDKAMSALLEEGLIIGMEQVEQREKEGAPSPMATNEGMLYINNTLNLQSDTVEEHQLGYLDNNLKTSKLEFTLEPVQAYVEESIRLQAEEKPNSNQP
ncbi:hypothetical protein QWY16_02170 [Planococcus shenhongbingii]|uniref:Uncharacterized protein n=1 Tax=Planococcus shenhongbingii TaxID=3058398 RepID=A0ABT8NG56_9BACL|nr:MULTISPECIES: hypothetical protein [unclassified Planococcus (in: firmicutes)]MDN7246652.1 hypothetical protein [Planococcus sp. N017]WKA58987.1 hypothetical protein QWY16_02170 [Planococcus sp. N016]